MTNGSAYNHIPQHWGRIIVSIFIFVIAYWATKPSSSLFEGNSAIETYEQQILARSERQQLSHGMVSHTNSSKLGFWLKDGLPDEFTPRIVWLMAWPFSGEDYILNSIQHLTNVSTATNYGEEVTLKGYFSIPIYPRRPEGPYWEGLGGQSGHLRRKLPLQYVLTKTQCSYKCFMGCIKPQDYYNESESKFSEACEKTTARIAPEGKLVSMTYPVERVAKSIHLVRNPFHNVIQRFLQEREVKKEDLKFSEKYPQSPKHGFQKWCKMMDDKSAKDDAKVYSKKLLKLAEKSPCHAEFYKYVQWHNHAFRTTDSHKENMVVYYEDFYTRFEDIIQNLAEFLKQKRMTAPYSFSSPHDYSRFYTDDMRTNVRSFVKELSSKETWDYLEHYFDHSS
jgi:hypothetical protein